LVQGTDSGKITMTGPQKRNKKAMMNCKGVAIGKAEHRLCTVDVMEKEM
jgi:hypothetical protein